MGGAVPEKDDVDDWICPKCRCKLRKGGDNSGTPIRPLDSIDTLNVTRRSRNTNDSTQLTAEIKAMRKEMTSLVTQLQTLSSTLADNNNRLNDVTNTLVVSEKRLKFLEDRELVVETLSKEVAELRDQLNIQNQASLRNEFEIAGVTESPNENLHHTILLTASKIGVSLEDSDIDWVGRVGPKKTLASVLTDQRKEHSALPRPIVVKLIRRSKRDEILKAAKSRRNLSTKDLELDGPQAKVYLNERLTRENRQLFRDTRIMARERQYKFCWISSGAIYVRKHEGKPAIHIRSKACLNETLSPAPGRDETLNADIPLGGPGASHAMPTA